MHQFEIALKNKKRGSYKHLAFFILLINIPCFAIFAFNSHSSWNITNAISGISLIAVSIVLEFYFAKNKKQRFNSRLAGLFFATFTWLMIQNWWASCINFLLLLLYNISQRSLIVSISSESVIYPSWPKKNLNWNQLNNVVLKDGLLTIDLKNNKLIQQAIDERKSSINEQEFNDFCRQQLNKCV